MPATKDDTRDLYQLLRVDPCAEPEVIERAYKVLASKYHPDHNPGDEERTNREFQKINDAYRILSDPDKRAEYDRTRRVSSGSSPRSSSPPRPTAAPALLAFGTITCGDSKTLKLTIDNAGGPAHDLSFSFEHDDGAVEVASIAHAIDDAPFPIVAKIVLETRALPRSYVNNLVINLDGVLVTVRISATIQEPVAYAPIPPKPPKPPKVPDPPSGPSPPSPSPITRRKSHATSIAAAVVVVLIAIAILGSVISRMQTPSTSPVPQLPAGTVNTVLEEDFSGSTKGEAYGITYASSLGGRGAVFTSEAASRIQYPSGIPLEGTLEWWIWIDDAYRYDNFVVHSGENCALIFATDVQGGDVTWPGATKFIACKDGQLILDMAQAKYNERPHQQLKVAVSKFRFGEWHALGISYGSEGQAIALDGQILATNPNNQQRLGAAGTHERPADIPTIGESVSSFWRPRQYNGGFQGVVYKFRSSPKQGDWVLAAQQPNVASQTTSPAETSQASLPPSETTPAANPNSKPLGTAGVQGLEDSSTVVERNNEGTANTQSGYLTIHTSPPGTVININNGLVEFSGEWSDNPWPPGTYAITASAKSMKTETRTVALKAGQHATVEFNLSAEPDTASAVEVIPSTRIASRHSPETRLERASTSKFDVQLAGASQLYGVAVSLLTRPDTTYLFIYWSNSGGNQVVKLNDISKIEIKHRTLEFNAPGTLFQFGIGGPPRPKIYELVVEVRDEHKKKFAYHFVSKTVVCRVGSPCQEGTDGGQGLRDLATAIQAARNGVPSNN